MRSIRDEILNYKEEETLSHMKLLLEIYEIEMEELTRRAELRGQPYLFTEHRHRSVEKYQSLRTSIQSLETIKGKSCLHTSEGY